MLLDVARKKHKRDTETNGNPGLRYLHNSGGPHESLHGVLERVDNEVHDEGDYFAVKQQMDLLEVFDN
jgi:hypothetical protein